jgi:hypothetical protein
VNVIALTTGVVVNFMNAGFGGNIQPNRNKNKRLLQKGIIASNTQNIAYVE